MLALAEGEGELTSPPPAIVMDNGTGYSKLGSALLRSRTCLPVLTLLSLCRFAGNSDPSFVFPTCIATRSAPAGSSTSRAPSVPSKPSGLGSGHLASKRGIEDLDFFIGDEAIANNKTYAVNYPIKHGQIEDWDQMERYWEQSIFKYLRAEPEDHYFLLVRFSLVSGSRGEELTDQRRRSLLSTLPRTEKPLPRSCSNRSTSRDCTSPSRPSSLSPPAGAAQRSRTARSRGLSLTLETESPTLSLSCVLPGAGGVAGADGTSDSQAEGYVIGSSIRHIPIAGRDISSFVQQLLRDRGENSIPPEDSLRVAEKIKEDYSYVCGDMVKEFGKYDKEPEKFFGVYEGEHSVTGKVRRVWDLGEGRTDAVTFRRAEVQGRRRLRALPRPRDLLQPRDRLLRLPHSPTRSRRQRDPNQSHRCSSWTLQRSFPLPSAPRFRR